MEGADGQMYVYTRTDKRGSRKNQSFPSERKMMSGQLRKTYFSLCPSLIGKCRIHLFTRWFGAPEPPDDQGVSDGHDNDGQEEQND